MAPSTRFRRSYRLRPTPPATTADRDADTDRERMEAPAGPSVRELAQARGIKVGPRGELLGPPPVCTGPNR